MTPLQAIRHQLHEQAFWARYQFAHEGWPGADRLDELPEVLDDFADDDFGDDDDDSDEADRDHESVEVRFDVSDGYGLLLSVATSLDSHTLELFSRVRPSRPSWRGTIWRTGIRTPCAGPNWT